ncbi:hypothetical protein GCM10011445_39270 [Pseudocitrobacter faecalis]|nr:hypothetical protein GCM10011445_39270 [Pseudocitrobacter faecalis]
MYKVYAQDCYARNGLNSIISDIKGIKNIELTVLYDQDEYEVSTLSRYWRDKDIACVILTNTINKKILISKNVLVMSIKSSVDEIKKRSSLLFRIFIVLSETAMLIIYTLIK